VVESGIVWSLGKNYRVRDSCAGACENIEFAQKKLRGLMGYWVGLNIKNIKIPIELGRVPGLAGWWLRPWAR